MSNLPLNKRVSSALLSSAFLLGIFASSAIASTNYNTGDTGSASTGTEMTADTTDSAWINQDGASLSSSDTTSTPDTSGVTTGDPGSFQSSGNALTGGQAAPEPGTCALIGLGLMAIPFVKRSRRSAR